MPMGSPRHPHRAPAALAVGLLLLLALGSAVATAAPIAPHPSAGGSVRAATGGTDSVVATVDVGSSPLSGTYDPATGDVLVPSDNDELAVISGGARPALVTSIDFPANPAVQTPLYDPANQLLYVALQTNGPADGLAIVNGSTDAIVGNIPTGDASGPSTPALDPVTGDLYVPLDGTDGLAILDPSSRTVLSTVPVGSEPGTPAVDPENGDVYVPNLASNNLTIISAARNVAVATIPGLNGPLTPVYDPVDQLVYVPESNGTTLTVLSGTTVTATLTVGDDPSTPLVDPSDGYLYVPNTLDNNVTVLAPGVAVPVANPVTGNAPSTPTYDPANGAIYVPNGLDGTVAAIDPAANRTIALTAVGAQCESATYDPASEQLFVPNFGDGNVSVIAAGPLNTSNAPGTYSVTFAQTGLPASVDWSVSLAGVGFNLSGPSITFYDLSDGTDRYAVIAPAGYYLATPAADGNVTVSGADRTVDVTFGALPGSGGGGGGSNGTSTSGLAGLPPFAGYAIAGALIILGAVAVTVLLTPKRTGRDGADEAEEDEDDDEDDGADDGRPPNRPAPPPAVPPAR